jgi:hypothetical protein
MNDRGDSLIGGCVLAFLALVGCFALCGGCAGLSAVKYSDGERVGTVTKFSNRGLLWKTWEGELLMGGVVRDSDGHAAANVWQFSVTDPAVVRELQEAQDAGEPVRLQYTQNMTSMPWSGDTSYRVIRVTRVKK